MMETYEKLEEMRKKQDHTTTSLKMETVEHKMPLKKNKQVSFVGRILLALTRRIEKTRATTAECRE